jgi:hypothetical protein
LKRKWTCCNFSLVDNHQAVDIELDNFRSPLLAERTVGEVRSGDAVEAERMPTVDQKALVVGIVKTN